MSINNDPPGYPPFAVMPGDPAGWSALTTYTAALSAMQVQQTLGGPHVSLAALLPLGLALDAHCRAMARARLRHPLAPGVDVDGLRAGDEDALAAQVAAFGGPVPW